MGHIPVARYLLESTYEERLSRMLMSKTKCLCRVYMIEGFDFAQRDIGSPSDPYLKMICGKKVYDEQKNYQLDEPCPKFHKAYDFEVEFPGAPPLDIHAYDYDDLFGDELIGSTSIDLDDRYFSAEWQSVTSKPIEYRQLYHPSSTVSQGVVKMWVEIFPTNKGGVDAPVLDITPRPIKDYEVRVVVWGTKDLAMMDVEGTSDAYVRCFFDTKDARETDTHFRCQDGKASFNYRLLYDFKAPTNNYLFTVQAWDKDFFASNDIIGECQLDLKPFFADVIETGRSMSITKKYYNDYLKSVLPADQALEFEDEDSFFVKVMGMDEKSGQMVCNGKVRITMTVLPKSL